MLRPLDARKDVKSYRVCEQLNTAAKSQIGHRRSGPSPRLLMPPSTRLSCGLPARSKACRQAAMRPLTAQEVILCNGAQESGQLRARLVLQAASGQPVRAPTTSIGPQARCICRRSAGRSAQQPRVTGPAVALPQLAEGLRERAAAGQDSSQSTRARTAAALVTEASHNTSHFLSSPSD